MIPPGRRECAKFTAVMEVELLWPLVQELVGEGPVSEEDWAFLKQSAEPLECPEEVIKSLIGVRQAAQKVDPLERLTALMGLVEALGKSASKKLNFILELTEALQIPVEIVQVLLQVPRKPILPFLNRLWRALPRTEERKAYEAWFRAIGQKVGLKLDLLEALISLFTAAEQKQTALALKSLWHFLSAFHQNSEYAAERTHLIELARESRISETLVKAIESFLQLRLKGQSPLPSLGEVIQALSKGGALMPEAYELLNLIAVENSIPEPLLQAMINIEEAIQERAAGKRAQQFGGEILEPLLRQMVSAQWEVEGQAYIQKRAAELGLSVPQLEALIELEKRLLEKSAKFPQHIQTLIRVLVEKGKISDDRVLYLVRKAQEMGGSEKVVRALIQIEVTAQRKSLEASSMQRPGIEPPLPSPPLETPKVVPPATTPSSPSGPMSPPPVVSSPPPAPVAPETLPPPPVATQTSSPISSIEPKIIQALPQTFPKGGKFSTIKATFSAITAFSLRSEKVRLRKCEIFSKGGRAHWYAVAEYEGGESLLIVKGKPEQHIGEILHIAASATGDIIALKERVSGGIRVNLNGDQSVTYNEVGSFVFSPNGRHLAYVAVKGQDQYPTLDNVAFRAYLYITELTFHPTAETDLYYIAQAEKNKWHVWNHLGQERSEAYPAIRLLTFSPDGKYMAYSYLKNRKFHVFDGRKHGPAYDSIGDLQFTPNSQHIFYSAQNGKNVEVLWDHTPITSAEGISNLTPSPNGEFIAYVAREKDRQAVYLHNRKLGIYEKVERLLVPQTAKPTVIYIAEQNGRHHIFINGAPESGPYEHIGMFSGRGESFAAIVRKDKETVQVVHNGQLGAPYTNIPLFVWDKSGNGLAYPARRKGGWSGVVWNGKESDHYEYPSHLTFSADGKALLFFARRRDGWYAVLNDQPIPESLCHEIITPPTFDEKSKSFYYLYRQEKEVREGRISIEG